jgi:photosystem II stability/assembly factor-like uncharacterized protein
LLDPGRIQRHCLLKTLSPKSLLLDIAILKDEVLVVGERGHILKSQDNGVSWRQITTPTRATLTNVFFVDDRNGWASGHSGIILSTNDAGDKWTRISEPDAEVSYFDAFFEDELNGFFVGSYGEYAKTNDAGRTLENESVNDDEPHFYTIEESPNGTLFLAGEMGQMHRSTNKGKSWKNLNFPYEGSIFDILCIDDNTVLAFGLRGNIFRSTDGGNHWNEAPNNEQSMLTAGIILASGNILLSTVADKILMSNDQGQSFYPITQPGIDGTVAVAESRDQNTILFCGKHGILAVKSEDLELAFKLAITGDE